MELVNIKINERRTAQRRGKYVTAQTIVYTCVRSGLVQPPMLIISDVWERQAIYWRRKRLALSINVLWDVATHSVTGEASPATPTPDEPIHTVVHFCSPLIPFSFFVLSFHHPSSFLLLHLLPFTQRCSSTLSCFRFISIYLSFITIFFFHDFSSHFLLFLFSTYFSIPSQSSTLLLTYSCLFVAYTEATERNPKDERPPTHFHISRRLA